MFIAMKTAMHLESSLALALFWASEVVSVVWPFSHFSFSTQAVVTGASHFGAVLCCIMLVVLFV